MSATAVARLAAGAPEAPTAEAPTAEAPHGTAACVNCGAPRAGPFCAACGQRARDGRLTLGHVAQHVAGELTPVDRGLAFTVLAMLRRPGQAPREYVDGRTVRYTGPVKFFALLAGLAQLLALRTRFLPEMVDGFFDRGAGPTVSQAAALAFLARYFVSLGAVAVPVFAWWTWLLCRRTRLNFAEHVVLALYTGAVQVAAFMLLSWLVIERLPIPKIDGITLVLVPVYQTWALAQFTGLSPARAAWRVALASVLTVASVTVALAVVLAALGRR